MAKYRKLTSLWHDANNFITIVDCFVVFHYVQPFNCNNKAFCAKYMLEIFFITMLKIIIASFS